MNGNRIVALGVFFAGTAAMPASAQTAVSVADSQWFTGPLVAPSSGPSKAGIFEIEPYAIFTDDTGAYGPNGSHQSVLKRMKTTSTIEIQKDFDVW
jgi:hypothetical protein